MNMAAIADALNWWYSKDGRLEVKEVGLKLS